MTSVIELENLSVTFGKRQILKSLDGALNGRAIGLLGPNGAGKTTLIHTLLGFHPPTSGTARIFGQDITANAKQVRAAVGYMPESDSFIAKTSCVHFVRLMAELSGIPADHALERAHEAERALVDAAHVRVEAPREPHPPDPVQRGAARLLAIRRPHGVDSRTDVLLASTGAPALHEVQPRRNERPFVPPLLRLVPRDRV